MRLTTNLNCFLADFFHQINSVFNKNHRPNHWHQSIATQELIAKAKELLADYKHLGGHKFLEGEAGPWGEARGRMPTYPKVCEFDFLVRIL